MNWTGNLPGDDADLRWGSWGCDLLTNPIWNDLQLQTVKSISKTFRGPRLGRSRATMHATAERIRSNQLPVRNRHNDPIGSNV